METLLTVKHRNLKINIHSQPIGKMDLLACYFQLNVLE